MKKSVWGILVGLFFNSHIAFSQLPVNIVTKKEKGIEIIQKDSLFSMQFQFRMQNRAGYMSESEKDLTPKDFEFRVRRLRMRLRGFVINPKFGYHVQLSFSRGDMDWESTNESEINTSVNVVRDAIVSYDATKSLKFIFGQTKLPGNRQRVVSSGNLQFADRSIVNSTFTIDRDFGFLPITTKIISPLKQLLLPVKEEIQQNQIKD
ncbi:MAG: porin [Bacteroidota bacterium]